MPLEDVVVLVGPDGADAGTMPRAQVHTADTPLHRGFSVHVFGPDGRVLLTRRALGKRTWPGVWTNSCCGHPLPGEDGADAVRRRVRQELGIELAEVHEALPDFRYRATDASGVVEYEICPVYVARTVAAQPDPADDEVAEWAWVDWDDLVASAAGTPRVFSPWAVEQWPQLAGADVVDRVRVR